MKTCKTCEEINFWEEHKKKDFKEKLFAKICVYTWSKHQRAVKGEQISTVTCRARDLNYCPTCGIKLKRKVK